MNGIITAILIVFVLSIVLGVDRWLYSEEKPQFLWRLFPAGIYFGAALYVYFRVGFNVFWLRNLWMLTLFLVSTAQDIRKKEIPIEFYPVFLIPALLLHIAQEDWLNLLVSIVLYGIFYLLAKHSREAIGHGDAVAIPTLCLLGGYQTASVIVLLALLLAGVVGLILLISRKASRKTEVPFIPFLAIAYLISLCF